MTTRRTLTVVIIGVLTVSAASQDPWDLIPESDEISGWVIDAESMFMCFHRRVTNPDSLFRVINGGAPVYTDRGYVNGVFEGYVNGGIELCLEIYNQGTESNALEVYAYKGQSMSDTQHVDIPGVVTARWNTGNTYFYIVDMVVASYFVRLTTQTDDDSKAAAGEFLSFIASATSPSSTQDVLQSGADMNRLCGPRRRIRTCVVAHRSLQGGFDLYGRMVKPGARAAGIIFSVR